jgi:hypothetical protein
MTQELGTRFLVYPQPPFVPGYERPETVWVSVPPGSILPGPSDARMYVVDPRLDKPPYDAPFLPPYVGITMPPAEPGPDGHFDHLSPDDGPFLAAHTFACVRFVLDVCQGFLGAEIPWFFAQTFERLEIIPHLPWPNAQSGFGFIELGEEEGPHGEPIPYALNFDVIAHEVGHLALLGVVGLPTLDVDREFRAYHEAAADLVSLIALLHFDQALDHILRRTRGSLLVVNELDRIGEISPERQIRLASNRLRMNEAGTEIHDLSRPFTGAVFDTLVETYQTLLFDRGISTLDASAIADLRRDLSDVEIDRALHEHHHDYDQKHFACKSALIEARDLVGECFVRSWSTLDPDRLTMAESARAMLASSRSLRAPYLEELLHRNFVWRGILQDH